MMNDTDIRKEMMRLWKDTFHDSDEYINLVFDAYFNPEFVEYEERDGRVVSAMMAVPYCFGNGRNRLHGLYLCGLATDPEYRRKGIMSGMIDRLAERMQASEYSFLFLIPADVGLQRYYKDQGFVNAFYRIKDRYTSVHDFNLEYENILNGEDERVSGIKRRYCERIICKKISHMPVSSEDEIDCVISYIMECELSGKDLGILHSSKDLSVAIKECIISGGCLYYCLNYENRITGVAFTAICENTVSVYLLIAADRCSYYRILSEIKKDYPLRGITLCRYPVKSESSGLWSPYYGAALPEAPAAGAVGVSERIYDAVAHSEVYGMARILNLREILKFQAGERSDLKYSILVKNDKNGKFERFRAKDGKLYYEEISSANGEPENSVDVMNRREVAEILFRRPDSDPIIEEVLSLPPLAGTINLMLD